MSSPVNDDRDKRAMYVPPWARDELHDEETRRIHADIVAAAERLKPPPLPQSKPQRPTQPSEAEGADRPPSAQAAERLDADDAVPASWQRPNPEPVEPPATAPRLRRSGWSTASRLAGAAGFAAIVALFVTGTIPLPSIDISLSRDAKDANAAAPTVAAVAPGARPTNAPMGQPPQSGTPTATVGSAPSPAPPVAEPPKPVAVAPAPPKPPSVLPEARVLDFMSREEIDGLLKRGQDLLATGDISGGRLLLTRAAEAGDHRASFALAGTYDSAVVATLGVVGAFPDPVKARAWYTRAAEQGSPEAARRLEQPHLRQR